MSDRPEDVDAAFAEIVADLEREGVGAMPPDLDDDLDGDDLDGLDGLDGGRPGPDEPAAGLDTGGTDRPGRAGLVADEPASSSGPPGPLGPTGPTPAGGVRPAAWRGNDAEWDWSWGADDEHYVPPEPPPLPKLRPLTIVALLLIVAGVVLMVVPAVLGLDPRIGTPIALVALICGGGMLLLRVRQSPRGEDEDPGSRDDGAQL